MEEVQHIIEEFDESNSDKNNYTFKVERLANELVKISDKNEVIIDKSIIPGILYQTYLARYLQYVLRYNKIIFEDQLFNFK